MRRLFLTEDQLASIPTDGYVEVVTNLSGPGGRPQFLPLSVLTALADSATQPGDFDTFAKLDALVADEVLINVSQIDTLAELNAIVADLNIIDTTQIDTLAELNSILTDATLYNEAQTVAPGSGETYQVSAQHTSSVERIGGFIVTTVFVDFTGYKSTTTDLDILGGNGADLAVNGAFTGDTDWTKGADWTLPGTVATAAPGAGTTLTPAAATTIVTGETYEVTYTMSGYVAGALNATLGGAALTARGSDATFVERVVAVDTTDLIFTSDAASDYDIDDVAIVHLGSMHLGQFTVAKNGNLFRGEVKCLQAPATGVTDIDFYSAPEVAGIYDDDVTDLTETVIRTNGGAWSAAPQTPIALTALPAADEYLYAACGAAGTVGTYSAGQFEFKFWGTP